MVHAPRPKLGEMGEPQGLDGRQCGAESSETFKQMPEEHPSRPCACNRRKPIDAVFGYQPNQMAGAFYLVSNFCEERITKGLFSDHLQYNSAIPVMFGHFDKALQPNECARPRFDILRKNDTNDLAYVVSMLDLTNLFFPSNEIGEPRRA